MIDSPEAYFQQITNTNNLNFTPNPELTLLKTKLMKELESKSSFSNELLQMPDKEKSILIAALIVNDQEKFVKLLAEPIKKIYPEASLATIRQITELANKDECATGDCLSPVVFAIIDKIIKHLSVVHRSILLQNAMHRIPDDKLHVAAKAYIAGIIDDPAKKLIENFSYLEAPESIKQNKFSGDISEKEYQAILNNDKIDCSEFIIVTLGALQVQCKKSPKANRKLTKIRQNYYDIDFPKAFKRIDALCEKNEITIGKILCDLILQKSKKCAAIKPNINENFTRRFYENRLLQLSKKEIDFKRFNKVSVKMTGIAAQHQDDLESLSIASMKVKKPRYFDIMHKLQSGSLRFKTRDRAQFGNFLPHEKEILGGICDEVFSKNRGVMTSNQPNFPDEISEAQFRNRVVDKNRARGRSHPEDKTHYSAYAASMSGHAFYFIPVLENYLFQNSSDPDLKDDINNYIKAFALGYASYGFHSYSEIMEVFDESIVRELLACYDIILEPLHSTKIIEEATRDTQAYTKAICLKKSVQSEIMAARSRMNVKETAIFMTEHSQLRYRIVHLSHQLEDYRKQLNYYQKNFKECGKTTKQILMQLKTISIAFNARTLEENLTKTTAELDTVIKQFNQRHPTITKDDFKKTNLNKIFNELHKLETTDKETLAAFRNNNTLLNAIKKTTFKKIHSEHKETKETESKRSLFIPTTPSQEFLYDDIAKIEQVQLETTPIETKTSTLQSRSSAIS